MSRSDGAMLSVAQVAALLGVRPHTVLALIRKGELPASDISLTPGGRPTWRIYIADLEAFIKRRRQATATQHKPKSKTRNVKKYF